eukprot:2617812-Heterocapsa_arctica.AAC.1
MSHEQLPLAATIPPRRKVIKPVTDQHRRGHFTNHVDELSPHNLRGLYLSQVRHGTASVCIPLSRDIVQPRDNFGSAEALASNRL